MGISDEIEVVTVAINEMRILESKEKIALPFWSSLTKVAKKSVRFRVFVSAY